MIESTFDGAPTQAMPNVTMPRELETRFTGSPVQATNTSASGSSTCCSRG
jgi:hypothetical protein